MSRRTRGRVETTFSQVIIMAGAASFFYLAGVGSWVSCALIVVGIRLAVPA